MHQLLGIYWLESRPKEIHTRLSLFQEINTINWHTSILERAIGYVVYTVYAQNTKGMILDILVIKFGMYWLDPDNLLSNNVLCSVSNCGIHEFRQLCATLLNHTLLNTWLLARFKHHIKLEPMLNNHNGYIYLTI